MAGVYLSYPFCAQKCTYCNFASDVFPASLEAEYTTFLEREVESWNWRWTPETVYWGGGSPNRMDPAVLERIHQRIPGRPWREATIECAPGEASDERVHSWVRSGINRISFGVQSFHRAELAKTGRKHNAEVVVAEVARARAAGVAAISLDLIAGLPYQTAETWNQSLEWIAKLGPEHVSVYMLEADDDSRLGLEILQNGTRYGAGSVPEEGEIADFYLLAVERLAAWGYRRYEISNFARPGWESLHNLKYWRREAYLGFGADAHSLDEERRWFNAETASQYVERSRAGLPVRIAISNADAASERFFLGLRLGDGIVAQEPVLPAHRAAIARHVELGLLERAGDRIRLSDKGILYSNEVFQDFLEN